MKKRKSSEATHKLKCRHVIGHGVTEYTMPCLILKTMDDGRLKVLVFGERNWKRDSEKQRVRYVPARRVVKK